MAIGDGTAWDETAPSNSTNLRDGDDHQRDLRKGIRIRLEKEHVTPATSSAGGEHTFLTLQDQGSKPTLSGSQKGGVYIKDVSGTSELFYEDSGGTEIQLSSGGAINVPSVQEAITEGHVSMWAGTIAAIPAGWLECKGQAVSRTTYADLFAAIDTVWGIGDGSTTFNLPDMRDTFPIGAKQDDSGKAKSNLEGSLNQSGGSATQPPKTENDDGGAFQPSGSNPPLSCSKSPHKHSFIPPYASFVFVIKT